MQQTPRDKQKLFESSKLAKRLDGAHYNLLEGYPFFAAAVLS